MTSLPTPERSRYAVYTGRSTNWPMVAVAIVGAVLLGIMGSRSDGAWGDPAFVVPVVIVAVFVIGQMLTGSHVRATAGPNGLSVRWGPIGWPRCTYRHDEIEHAEVVDLPWWRVSYGFWWTPRRTNSTVRSGPSLHLTLRNQRTATITVPDPDAALAALQSPAAARPSA